jgi:hypothetical protein
MNIELHHPYIEAPHLEDEKTIETKTKKKGRHKEEVLQTSMKTKKEEEVEGEGAQAALLTTREYIKKNKQKRSE